MVLFILSWTCHHVTIAVVSLSVESRKGLKCSPRKGLGEQQDEQIQGTPGISHQLRVNKHVKRHGC